jgi:putative FmdB family regulatory protein
MAIYEYRCDRDGGFELMLPLGTAPDESACPDCGGEARRVFSPPLLKSGMPRALMAALDHEEKTRYEPDVVTKLPPKPPHKRTPVARLTPALARLPRP